MTEEEKKLFRLYGKLPTHKNVLSKVAKASHIPLSIACALLLSLVGTLRGDLPPPLPPHHILILWILLSLRPQDRKYFDSGDYAMSKAGVTPQNAVGTAIPSPEK